MNGFISSFSEGISFKIVLNNLTSLTSYKLFCGTLYNFIIDFSTESANNDPLDNAAAIPLINKIIKAGQHLADGFLPDSTIVKNYVRGKPTFLEFLFTFPKFIKLKIRYQ